MSLLDRRNPGNTAIVLIDYVESFKNTVKSQTPEANVIGAVALAKTALGLDVPLVVTAGPEGDPRGPMYKELLEELNGHPVVARWDAFDAFDAPGFPEAIEATGRKHLVVAGLTTDVCVLHTAMGALRRGYGVSIVVDATGGTEISSHEAAIGRLVQAGATTTSWMSLATELVGLYANDSKGVLPQLLALDANLTAAGLNEVLSDLSPTR
ncbi:isochorismatase family protein [Actinoplanes sp. NPDC000266]